MGTGRHDTVTAVDVGDPVADLLALVEGLADNSFVVVLPSGGRTPRFVGPGRLRGDVLGVGLGGVEASDPTDQGIAEQVAPVIGVVIASSQVMGLQKARGFPTGRPIPSGGPVLVLPGRLIQPGVTSPGAALTVHLVNRVGSTIDVGVQASLVIIDDEGPVTIPDNVITQLLTHGWGQHHRRLLLGWWLLLLVAIVAGLRRIAFAPGHEALNSLAQGSIARGWFLDYAPHDKESHNTKDNVPNFFLHAVHI